MTQTLRSDIMVNAWSLAASILDGTFEEDYPLMNEDDDLAWIEETGGFEWTPGSPWPPGEPTYTITEGSPEYKYNEDEILDSMKEYIGKTYSKH